MSAHPGHALVALAIPIAIAAMSGCGRNAAQHTDAAGLTHGTAPAGAPKDATRIPGQPFRPAGFDTLVFTDEFDGTALDRTKWCTRYQFGGGPPLQVPDPGCLRLGVHGTLDWLNDEQQRYVDVNRDGEPMHVVADGVLALRATRTRDDGYASYESAMIRSKITFRPDTSVSYYFTARVRLPAVRGTWPAFWLSPEVDAAGRTGWPPEIDIFEGALNDESDTASMLRIGAQAQNWGGEGVGRIPVPVTFAHPQWDPRDRKLRARRPLRDVWIDTGLEWRADGACYFVDGTKIACETYAWLHNDRQVAPPAPILLNLGIGGHWAGRNGVDAAAFPVRFEIDHVRVWERRHVRD